MDTKGLKQSKIEMCDRISDAVLKEIGDFERETGIAVLKIDAYPEYSKADGVLRRTCRTGAVLDV